MPVNKIPEGEEASSRKSFGGSSTYVQRSRRLTPELTGAGWISPVDDRVSGAAGGTGTSTDLAACSTLNAERFDGAGKWQAASANDVLGSGGSVPPGAPDGAPVLGRAAGGAG